MNPLPAEPAPGNMSEGARESRELFKNNNLKRQVRSCPTPVRFPHWLGFRVGRSWEQPGNGWLDSRSPLWQQAAQPKGAEHRPRRWEAEGGGEERGQGAGGTGSWSGSAGLPNGKHASAAPRGARERPLVPIFQLSPAVCPTSGLCRSALPASPDLRHPA